MIRSLLMVKNRALCTLALLIMPGLAFGDGMLYGAGAYGMYKIDPVTGASQYLGNTLGALSGYGTALAINPVPIPPAVWLFGSALGLMGVIRRKSSAAIESRQSSSSLR
ncbi:MAG: hypothetical protein EXR82_09385 [Gammaproteobacteria bacterium]|nr:hypothetical protein [Gammaproteobacteria bacterium]